MLVDDTEHPEALLDAKAIDAAGGLPYAQAIGELVAVLDQLFDGPGTPDYAGATKTPVDVFFEQPPPAGPVRLFTRQCWGSGGASIVAAVGQKVQRPALLAIVALGLPTPGAQMLDYAAAEALALTLARRRSVAM